VEFEISTLRTALEVGLDPSEAQKHRLEQLNELDEIRLVAVQKTTVVQQQRMKWHDKFIKSKVFHVGDWALLYDSRFKDFKGKLCTHWMGPYQVDAVFDNGTVRLVTIDENHTSFLVNGHRLKLYHRPASRNAFVKHLSDSSDLMVVGMKDTLTLP
jgi:hypothetical protein